jgi:G3E family GTPase
MDLFEITPLRPEDAPGSWIPGLLRALLLRTQFSHARARVLGWRGIRPSLAFGECWTFRLRGLPGVHGLLFEGEEPEGDALRGEFSLHYFPAPDEPRAEMLPLAAGVLCQRPEYWDLVREFPARDETRELFRTGALHLRAAASGRSLGLELAALSRQVTLAPAGLDWPPGSGNFVVPPGGRESDVAAWALSLPLFRVLAATLSFQLGEPPSSQALERLPGRVRVWRAGRPLEERPGPDVRLLRLRLDWGGPQTEPAGPFRRQPWLESHRARWFEEQTPDGRDRLPELLVLTGFLGAGKTTLLRRFIEHNQQHNRFVAVIQNEIGAVGLDGRLLEQDSPVLEMDEGCVCCSLSGQLKKGLARILERFRPDVVVLEMSGLANPKNILAELREVRDLVRRGPVLAVADAPDLERALAESAVARDQLEHADVLVLNKCDLLAPDQAGRLERLARERNPRALVLTAVEGAIPFGLLQDPDLERSALAWDDLLPHFHGHGTHADEDFTAQTLRLPAPVDPERLRPALERAAARAFRIKGVLDVPGEEDPVLVQAVAGRLNLEPLPGYERSERFLVCIGRGLPADFAASLARDLGRPA